MTGQEGKPGGEVGHHHWHCLYLDDHQYILYTIEQYMRHASTVMPCTDIKSTAFGILLNGLHIKKQSRIIVTSLTPHFLCKST